MKRIRKLLVANRGEIAVRIQRTAQQMGIATVAVFSDADADTPAVKMADQAVRIGAPPSAESYLCIDKLIEAAKQTGADAIHPGFGFLAENAELAQACADAGIVFVGPSPEAIRAMGSKKEAKRIVSEAGVPVVPGVKADDQAVAALADKARSFGFPLLLKASAGGGGKGMRIVRSDEGLESAIESAKREAKSAFGDDTLLIEKYVDRPRHVEIQILGDSHGNLVHLYERECSIQRRHQKIVEETPSPALDAELRRKMGEAAVAVGKAVGYENAGTVEFILSPEGEFFFLEVNTRLQVEHPITECVTGVDIVREQLRIAQGEALDFSQSEVPFQGAAIECRLYAEDPDNDFLPTSGSIVDWHLPALDGLRVDTGIETGSVVSIHYDPMLAKLVTHAPTRPEAIQKMVRALSGLSVQGIKTNRAFLVRVLEHPEFLAGNTHTHFIEQHLASAPSDTPTPALERLAAIAATLAAHAGDQARREVLPALPVGFRNNRYRPAWVDYRVPSGELRVEYLAEGDERFQVGVGGSRLGPVRLVQAAGHEVVFEDGDGLRHRARVVRRAARHYVHFLAGSVVLDELPRFPDPESEHGAGTCTAPMPGKVVRVLVENGQKVSAGEVILILEAMKMEHSVKAPEDGTVTEIDVAEGDQVDADAVLAVVTPNE